MEADDSTNGLVSRRWKKFGREGLLGARNMKETVSKWFWYVDTFQTAAILVQFLFASVGQFKMDRCQTNGHFIIRIQQIDPWIIRFGFRVALILVVASEHSEVFPLRGSSGYS